MKHFRVISAVLILLSPSVALSQTYTVDLLPVSGPCMNQSQPGRYTVTVTGSDLSAKSTAGSGFVTKINPDGTFKATFKSFTNNRDLLAEGKATGTPKSLRITNPALGCVFEAQF